MPATGVPLRSTVDSRRYPRATGCHRRRHCRRDIAAFGVSVTTPFLLTGLIDPAIAQRGDGAIVNIGSISGNHRRRRVSAVNAVAPGPIATQRNEEFADAIAPVLARVPSDEHRRRVACAVVFLTGPQADNIQGTILTVNGGATAV